jgi:sugar (pentulose or hexulose) kinase
MDHQKAAYQICATQRDTLLAELEKVGKHPECTEAAWKAILAAMAAAREAAKAKEREIRAAG